MEKSPDIKEIANALLLFQSKVKPIKKQGENPYFKSKYATLDDILENIRVPLQEANLSFSQFPSGDNELVTILLHTSGQYLMATAKMVPKDNTPQGQGSAITYMRRYALSAILGIATEEDDDGNKASTIKPNNKPKNKAKLPTIEHPQDDITAIKLSITEKLEKLTDEAVSRENVHSLVKEKTGLNLIEENYEEIDIRLGVLLTEQKDIEQIIKENE